MSILREHASDAVDIDPLFFSLCLHGIQEDISVILKGKTTGAPRKLLACSSSFFCQGMAQRFLVQPGCGKEGGVFPGAGRRSSEKPQDAASRSETKTIQMMRMQTICADGGSAEFHDDHLCLYHNRKAGC